MSIDAVFVMRILFSAFTAILFVQSGLDKVFNYREEQAFYKKHFSKSILHGTVGLLMPTITVAELAAGFLSAAGLVVYLLGGSKDLACWGMLFSCLSILMLFLGQRIAKDYAGAQTLATYFLVVAAGLYFYWI